MHTSLQEDHCQLLSTKFSLHLKKYFGDVHLPMNLCSLTGFFLLIKYDNNRCATMFNTTHIDRRSSLGVVITKFWLSNLALLTSSCENSALLWDEVSGIKFLTSAPANFGCVNTIVRFINIVAPGVEYFVVAYIVSVGCTMFE